MLQTRSHRVAVASPTVESESADIEAALPGPRATHVWKSEERVMPALHYFSWWAAGKIKNNMRGLAAAKDSGKSTEPGMVQADEATGKTSVASVAGLLAKHREEFCPKASKPAMPPGLDW